MEQEQTSTLEAFKFLIGKWNTEGEVLATAEAPALHFKGTDTYEWILNGSFIQHKVDVMMGEEYNETIEMMGEYDSHTHTIALRAFDNRGRLTTMHAHLDEAGRMHITGHAMRATLTVVDANNMQAEWERAGKDNTWLTWMRLTLSK